MKSDLDVAKTLILKAANDIKTAQIGIEHDGPLDAVAFHVQQAAEKLLKALLASRGVAYPLTHDLRALLNLVVNEIPELESFRERLLPLNPYAVEIRYDHSVTAHVHRLSKRAALLSVRCAVDQLTQYPAVTRGFVLAVTPSAQGSSSR